MAKKVISIGTAENDGTGDSLRTAGTKINENFTEIYNALGGETGAPLSIVSSVTGSDGIAISSPKGDITVTLLPATDIALGGIKPGTGITVAEDGTASVVVYELPVASSTISGGIKVGTNLTITNGVLSASVTDPYTLPTASVNTKGGVKIGTGLEVVDGVLNTLPPQLTPATDELIGGVKIGAGLSVDETGLISVTPGGAASSLIVGSYEVSLGTDGYLNLPNGQDEQGAVLQSTDPIRIIASTQEWKFDLSGVLTFPDSTTQDTAWTGVLSDLTNGDYTLALGTDGILSVPAQANFQFEGTDIIQINTSAVGGTIAGFVDKVVQVTTQTETDGYTWKFDEQGRFILPNGSYITSSAVQPVVDNTTTVTYSSFDTSELTYEVVPGDTVDFPNFSGQILVNDHSATGQLDLWLCGGAYASRLGTSKDSDESAIDQGTVAMNSEISGYTWTSNLTGTVSFAVTRTRTGA